MFAQFFQMFKQLFSVVTTVAEAAELGAQALRNVASVTQETSAVYVEEARIKRAIQLSNLEKELNDVEAKNRNVVATVKKAA